MTGARVLACAGTIASLLTMLGAPLIPTRPALGSLLVGASGFVMLSGNIWVALFG